MECFARASEALLREIGQVRAALGCSCNPPALPRTTAGGTGFIGSKLVSALLTLGYRVRVLTRNVGTARAKLPYAGVEYVGPAQWAQAVRGCTAVVNLAGGLLGPQGAVSQLWRELKRQAERAGSRPSVRELFGSCLGRGAGGAGDPGRRPATFSEERRHQSARPSLSPA